MSADRSESRRATNPWRAAAIAERATGPISTPSPPNATRRKLPSEKSLLRFTSTVIRRSSGTQRCRSGSRRVQCGSGLGGVPEEELPLRRQVVVEVGEDDRRLIEEEPLDLACEVPRAAEVHGRDVLLREIVEGWVVEMR